MIYDKLENIEMYKTVHPKFAKAIEWIKSTDLNSLEVGKKVFIDEKNIFAIISEYKTASLYKKSYEGHKEYIDIQIVLKGREVTEQAFLKGGEEEVRAYNPEKDNYKCHTEKDSEFFLERGNFAIFFPHDLHKPCINCAGRESEMRKVVVKIRVE